MRSRTRGAQDPGRRVRAARKEASASDPPSRQDRPAAQELVPSVFPKFQPLL